MAVQIVDKWAHVYNNWVSWKCSGLSSENSQSIGQDGKCRVDGLFVPEDGRAKIDEEKADYGAAGFSGQNEEQWG